MVSEVNGSQSSLVSTLANSQQAEQAESKARKPESNESSQALPRDGVSLTDTAAKLRGLEEQVAKQPIVDSQRVESVKKAIADGTFKVDANKTAEKMAEFENLLSSKIGDK